MTDRRSYLVVGLMCGTSHDGVDAAVIETDGAGRIARLAGLVRPFPDELRRALAGLVAEARALGAEERAAFLAAQRPLEERFLTAHVEAAAAALRRAGRTPAQVDAVGFHGLTLLHRPAERFTWQWGSPARLAALIGRPVIADLRLDDIAAGGEGAPLVPVHHHALVRESGEGAPVAVLNIGGVANVTWVDPARPPEEGLIAFDTGPGNGLIDAWMARHAGAACDRDGRTAEAGRVDEQALSRLLAHPHFLRPPPKSLDKFDFDLEACAGLSTADGARTLAAFTVEAVARAARWFPRPVAAWWVTGGGRRNPLIMRLLAERLDAPVLPVEAAGFDGDTLEAEAFAWLAARRLAGLPSSFPATTGVRRPTVLGRIYRPPVSGDPGG